MIFNTWTFGVFLAVFAIIYWTLVPRRGRPLALLAAGLIFYTYYYPLYTILIIGFTAVVFILGRWVGAGKAGKKLWLVTGLVICVGFLAYFKYLKLFIPPLNEVLTALKAPAGLPVPDFLIPLGLSFFVFEFIHYLVDVYQGTARQTSWLNFSVFALFFPTLVAGPIKRYQPFLEQMENLPSFSYQYLTYGTVRILMGLAKKVIIADSMNLFITPFQNPHMATNLELWIAVYAYAIKIYFDFSGYSDIAIGSARLLGFKIPENFNYPYLQSNISEFWRNWHISLSSWIRDYIYIPLGGNRRGKILTYVNLLIAMGLCGLWHGAAWNFVLWGLYHGLGMVIYRIYKKYTSIKLPRVIGILLTFNFVAVGWVLFANDTGRAIYILQRILLQI